MKQNGPRPPSRRCTKPPDPTPTHALPDDPRPFAGPLRGAPTGATLGLNTVLVSASLVPPALLKLLLPAAAVQPAADRVLNALASAWVAVNNAWIAAVRPAARWDV